MPWTFDPAAYGPAVAELLTDDRLPDLGPGRPNTVARPLLERLTPELLLAGRPVRDRDMARACLAALWLLHDFLDDSHTISQEIETPTGSYWHGIMHRREPDPGNAKYWFRRVGQHPVFADLPADAADLGFKLRSGVWDPFAFIDRCEKCRGTGDAEELLARRMQRREWERLFDWCYRQATAEVA